VEKGQLLKIMVV